MNAAVGRNMAGQTGFEDISGRPCGGSVGERPMRGRELIPPMHLFVSVAKPTVASFVDATMCDQVLFPRTPGACLSRMSSSFGGALTHRDRAETTWTSPSHVSCSSTGVTHFLYFNIIAHESRGACSQRPSIGLSDGNPHRDVYPTRSLQAAAKRTTDDAAND